MWKKACDLEMGNDFIDMISIEKKDKIYFINKFNIFYTKENILKVRR